MLRQIATVDSNTALSLPQEVIDALELKPGAKVKLEIVGRSLIVRSLEEAERSEEFSQAFQSILKRRKSAYELLAKGE